MNRICFLRIAATRLLKSEANFATGHNLNRSSLHTTVAGHPRLQRLHNTEGQEKVINPDEPIKFFGSEAAKWKAEQTRSGRDDKDKLWYQPYVIMGSLLAFMIYFCVLREESDVDGELNKTLYERVDGLEEIQLGILHKYNLENNLDNSKIEDRMQQLNISIPKY